jgi:hypothetical protein
MKTLVQLVLACGMFAQLTAAAAAPIYRCGPDGREYSQTPCPGGQVVEGTDPRSAAQRAEGRRIAAQERKLDADLARERREREKAAPPRGPASLSTAPASSASDTEGGKRPKKPRVPKSPAKPKAVKLLQPIKSPES